MATDDIMENVKIFHALDEEIKKSTKLMTDLRKKRKVANENILVWLQKNDKARIKTKKYGTLERTIKSRKITVNAQYVQECAASFLNNEESAANLTRLIFDMRPTEEREVLVLVKPKAGGGEAAAASVAEESLDV